ncbi:related to transposase [Sporisorium reilianum f. sp. reilianum]|uniref:Related to transposase n=1 Tax=Sporisorium reilianum f. sp. reilianum TaxID=72559 RepID=A0A2N8UK87_9BASI|nr:related to transposase [Sporisorium reilianum f. sp. reilianum]
MDGINKAQFGTFYAQAREKVLTQSAAQKAFSDSRISIDPSPEKALHHLASGSIVTKASTPQCQPLQEIAMPRLASAFNATLDATLNTHAQEPGSCDARALKRTIQQANEEAQASIAILEAKVAILQAQQDRKSKTSAKLGRKHAQGDTWVLTKDRIITQEEAERALAEKEASTSTNRGGNCQEEEEVVAAPSAAVIDRDDTLVDRDEAISASSTTTTMTAMLLAADDLDDGEPLSAISDDEEDPFGFFETLPKPGPSRMRH